MDIVFGKSKISEELKTSLARGEYMKVRQEFVTVLRELWFCEGLGEAQGYVRNLGQLLAPILENGSIACSSLSHLPNMVPSEVRHVTTSLLDQLQASLNVSKIKQGEKARTRELSVREELFRKSYVINQKRDDPDNDALVAIEVTSVESKPSAMEPSDPARDSTIYESSASRRKRHSVSNPYARGKHSYANGPPPSGNTQAPAPTGTKMNLSTLLERRKRALDDDSKADEARSAGGPYLKAILRQSEEEMFTGVNPSAIRTLSSNAPLNLSCTICERALEKPFISDCGHMACLNCWQQWLDKSRTCPVCRKPASPSSIALAVFQGGVTKR
jgi:Zinc finger, C3HC4 type (RING finger)